MRTMHGINSMRSLHYVDEEQSLYLGAAEIPHVLEPDDVIVRMAFSGICGSDIKILSRLYSARSGVILGHEGVGIVSAVGTSVKSVAPGDRVVAGIIPFCGVCSACRGGVPTLCHARRMLEVGVWKDGTFADYFKTKERAVYCLPKEIPLRLGTLVEPLACVLSGLNRVDLRRVNTALVMGGGPIGVLFAGVLRKHGIEVVVAEVDSYRRQCLEKMGFSTLCSASPDISELGQLQLQEEFDLVVDAVGNLLSDGIRLARPGGYILLFGLEEGCTCAVDPSLLVMKELTIAGSIDCCDTVDMAILFLQSNPFLEELITAEYPLDQYKSAFQALGYPGGAKRAAMKVLLTLSPEE